MDLMDVCILIFESEFVQSFYKMLPKILWDQPSNETKIKNN